ncbi:1,4-alpha-glucan branching enzyme/starch branching enzyme II [Handroanthus impetiginosus]|uniref:1,4-alpha-glucan branching enzyme/starch branching enzyme II n=1 Tax=Handroanthus impetiginosus TaxID=429701 RepID=A0A2G9GHT4_9LAMI|nr:1,4-alpha-glucan branching enzyme/starch branching enzyme II [Handroanthus impetiginosus]
MSLLCSSPRFLHNSKNVSSHRLPPKALPLPTSLTGRRLGGGRRIVKLRASSKLRCSSAMAVNEGPTSSPSSLQDSMLCSRAFWVSKGIIAWDVDPGDGSCCLCYDVKVELEERSERLPEHVIEKFPHIRDFKPLHIPPALDVKNLSKYQLAVAVLSSSGECTTLTGLQLPGVLDELFCYHGPLGAIFSSEAVSLYLWAPTAQDVKVLIYREPESGDPFEVVQLKESNGVWSVKGPLTWEHCYYVYEVSVYHPSTLRIEKCIANDPYARGLSATGRRTLLVNLDSEALKPEAWDHLADEKPDVRSFSDISIYELHVRDFSATDNTVLSDFRGGYLAFTSPDSAGMLHLKKLSGAGITHIHLLPTFHFGDVDDNKGKWKNLDFQMLESFPPDSDEQQACITAIQNEDGYNWGYNPVVWGVPKGSYASNPNGSCRIIEFRKMVQALNRIGLRVVLDVVYNHLHASGPFDENSVLDKIVPGYYLRRNLDGFIEHSTCINNTASEHSMVERLIFDDLLHWAVNYKVDGFRFDLMGHIMKRTMVKARSMLQKLSKQNDGVDGSRIYIYGEGWNFGEVANNARGVNASQFNLCGTGIGSFNDRIRDAMLGGSPFGHPLQQGFITGLSLEPNDHDHGSKSAVEYMLAVSKDHIQVGMAANLKDFVLTNHNGQEVKGCEILMHDGVPLAYASSPVETVNYVSAHDNETLFDIVSLKTLVNISVDARCRMNHLATSIIALCQGIPFFHAGDEILRSKSLDRDSYNSGDWFNRLDFSYNSNNWGVGLPPKEKNERNWPLIKTRLADPAFKPQRSHILAALENFCTFIKIRYSSPLFHLGSANAIQERVRFHNTGPSWVPGVIVMSIEDGYEGVPGLSQLDPIYSHIVVIVNVCPTDITFTSPSLRGKCLQLHPVQVLIYPSFPLFGALNCIF